MSPASRLIRPLRPPPPPVAKQHHFNTRTANTLVSIDLSRDWTNASVTLLSSPKPRGVPSLRNGGIWVNGKTGALYTGFAGTASRFGDQAPSAQGLWSFTPDIEASGTWESLNESTDGWFRTQERPYGALATSGRGLGFLFCGKPLLLSGDMDS